MSAWDRLKFLVFGAPMEGEDDIRPFGMDKRKYSFLDIFLIFSGTQIAISFFVVGAGTVQGLTVLQAFVAVFLGYGIVGGLIVGFIGKIGFNEGIPTMVATRSAFGIRGSILPVIITFIELTGWTAVQVALGGSALNTLIVSVNPALQSNATLIISVVIIGVATLLIATRGGRTIKKMSDLVVPILIISLIYVAYIAMGKYSFGQILNMKNEGTNTFLSIFDVMIVSALTWAPMAADYTRMGKTSKGSMYGVWLSLLIVTPVIHMIGMISAVGLGVPNPLTALGSGIGSLIALFMILFATLTTSVLILYSTAMAGINMMESFGKKVPLWAVATVVGIPAIILATKLEVVFFVIPYLDYLGGLLAPLFGIMIFDYYFTNRGKLSTDDLYKESGRYWGQGGFNVPGYISWIVGAVSYFYLLKMVRPYHSWVIVSLISLVLSGIIYLILKKKTVSQNA
ncbi:MAG: purine-cytosine permease family protein [Desulfitobacteriaceae bacterium]